MKIELKSNKIFISYVSNCGMLTEIKNIQVSTIVTRSLVLMAEHVSIKIIIMNVNASPDLLELNVEKVSLVLKISKKSL